LEKYFALFRRGGGRLFDEPGNRIPDGDENDMAFRPPIGS
jgi:hypothetical protein